MRRVARRQPMLGGPGEVRRPMRPDGAVNDARFRRLLGPRAWSRLAPEVRRRFSKHLGPGESQVFRGRIVETRHSLLGWAVAQAARLIGAPLPLARDVAGLAATVSITDDPILGGQIWTRLYARPDGFPQVLHSAKRFAGPTGLEELVGGCGAVGVGMSLALSEDAGGLVFRSTGMFLKLGRRRARLPRWLTPGGLVIRHRPLSPTRFAFDLALDHPVFGALIRQRIEFDEAEAI